jgi:hypothetical protein
VQVVITASDGDSTLPKKVEPALAALGRSRMAKSSIRGGRCATNRGWWRQTDMQIAGGRTSDGLNKPVMIAVSGHGGENAGLG